MEQHQIQQPVLCEQCGRQHYENSNICKVCARSRRFKTIVNDNLPRFSNIRDYI